MFNPIRYVDNNFEDPKFSDADLRSFSEDHLIRLAQPDNNPGSIYSTLLGDTTTKYNAYYGKMSSQAVQEAIAEGATITRNNARKTVQEKIDAMQGFAKFKYGETSAEYQQMYPLGIMEYTRAREGDIGPLFNRFVTAATALLNAFYPAEVLDVTNAVSAFHAAYIARETVVAQVDNLITGKNSDRIALTTQLTQNFLIIASNNISNPDKFDDYYDPRFLPLSSDNGETLIKSFTLPGNQTVYNVELPAGLTVTGSTKFRIKNKATGAAGLLAVAYFALTAIDGPGEPPIGIILNPGDETLRTATELGWVVGKPFLNAMAPGPATVDMEVWLVE